MADGDRRQSKLPSSIGRYQIQGSLGAGAMGAVYKGFDPLIKRTLAIKTIRLDIPRDSEDYKTFLERFYQEARISGTLAHPNIVTLFDIGEDNGLPFLALEFIEGETVEAMLARGVNFRPEKVVALVSQVASALDYAHSKGVIHRDIKPANLLVYDEDQIKVMDFGIAKLADSEMTKVGQLLGTPSYMSPEQAMGEKLDGRSDIFSLGVCAFEMLSGQQPFPGTSVTAILYKLVHVEPVQPENIEMNGLIPQKWHEVFPRVLSKKREDRYQTAAEFVRDLELCLGSWFSGIGDELVPTEAVPLPTLPDEPRRRPSAQDEPSIVVSIDEIQAMMPEFASRPAARPSAPAIPEDDELPATVAMKPGDSLPPTLATKPGDSLPPTVSARPGDSQPKTVSARPGDSLPPTVSAQRPSGPALLEGDDDMPATVAVQRPPATAEDEVPETVAVQRPAVAQEKTVLLSAPTGGKPLPAEAPPPADVPRPGSQSPYKPSARFGSRPQLPPRSGARQTGAGMQASEAPGPLEVRPKRLSRGLIAAGVVGVLLAAAIVAYVVVRSRGNGGSAEIARGDGSIVAETTPPDATVRLYDVAHDRLSTTLLDLAPGTYEVIAELEGYEPASETLSLEKGDPPAHVSLVLEASQDAMGEADILSVPAGASVFVDEQPEKVGLTALRGHPLRVGNRRIRLTTAGYRPYVGFLRIETGKPARLEAHLVGLGSSPPPAPGLSPPEPLPSAPPSASAKPPTAPPTPRRAPTPTAPPTAAPTPAPTPAPTAEPTPEPPTRQSVDTTRVYAENQVETKPGKLSGDSYQPRLKSGETLSVTVAWTVTETGEVTDIEVVESGGKALDDGVLQALRNWRYAPGVKQGVKVKVRMARKYTFRAG